MFCKGCWMPSGSPATRAGRPRSGLPLGKLPVLLLRSPQQAAAPQRPGHQKQQPLLHSLPAVAQHRQHSQMAVQDRLHPLSSAIPPALSRLLLVAPVSYADTMNMKTMDLIVQLACYKPLPVPCPAGRTALLFGSFPASSCCFVNVQGLLTPFGLLFLNCLQQSLLPFTCTCVCKALIKS